MTAAASLLTAWETLSSQGDLWPASIFDFSFPTLSHEVRVVAAIFHGKGLIHGWGFVDPRSSVVNLFLTRVASSRQNSLWVLVRMVVPSPKAAVLTRLTFLEGLCPKNQDLKVGSLETLIPFFDFAAASEVWPCLIRFPISKVK